MHQLEIGSSICNTPSSTFDINLEFQIIKSPDHICHEFVDTGV